MGSANLVHYSAQSDSPAERKIAHLLHFARRRIGPFLFSMLLFTGFAVAMWGSWHWAERSARAESDRNGLEMARTHADLLSSELQKFRLLPLVLADYPEVRDLLERPTQRRVDILDNRLQMLAGRTNAGAIYVIDRQGLTLAASNWNLPKSFVGQNFAFRPYVKEALESGSSEMFALGVVSARPGLFIAHQVRNAGGQAIGVVVVKVEFDRIEAQWQGQPGPTFVTDKSGIIILTSRPAWRFRSTTPLSEADRQRFRQTIQFGGLPLAPLDLKFTSSSDIMSSDSDMRMRDAQIAVPLEGAMLHYFQPLNASLNSALANARATGLLLFMALALLVAAIRRNASHNLAQIARSEALEAEVAARTRQLRETNAQLVATSAEREATEARYRSAREELAQASRLASLGQITAGVAHEINQPLAAMTTYAENALSFIRREELERAAEASGRIVELCHTIGSITAELKSFARRRTPSQGAVALDQVIDGALLLTGDELRRQHIGFDRCGVPAGVFVSADKVRLEQVLINLLQNAADALANTDNPTIRLTLEWSGTHVLLRFSDNGEGISVDMREHIFTPFVTSKSDGLGLGLGIARDIMREFGGNLELEEQDGEGTSFLITLKLA